MSCRRYRDSVVLLADGELTEDAAAGVRSHVAGCRSCRETLAELERLGALLAPAATSGAHASDTVAEARFWRSFEADLALRVNRRATPIWRRRVVLPVPAAVAAGVAIVALGAVILTQRHHNERLSRRNAHLEAAIKTVVEEGAFAFSPGLIETLQVAPSQREPAPARLVELWHVAEPAAAATPAPRGTARLVPARAAEPPATPRLPPGMQIRFVDSESADFY